MSTTERVTSLLRRAAPDLAPWHGSRDFRLLWTSGAATIVGSFFTYVALPLQIKQLTGSSLAVGLIGAAELVPLIVFGLWGGALADAVDRRRLVLLTETGHTVLAALVLANALLPHPMLWPLYAIAAAVAAMDGIQRPALDALLPRIVPHDQLPAASALNSMRWSAGSILGPLLGGALAATAGVRWAYLVDLLSFAVSLYLLARVRAVPPPPGAEKPSLRGIAEGVRYACSRQDLLGTYAVDLAAMLLAFPVAVFPFLADALHAPWALGPMYAADALGALLVTLTSGWTKHVRRHGRWVAGAAAVWGLCIAAAGLAPSAWAVLVLLVAAGAADMVSGMMRTVLWNQTIPDRLRGRLAGIELLSFSAGPQLGQVRAGGTAAAFGVRRAVWIGGLACTGVVAAVAAALPGLLRHDARTSPYAAEVRASRRTEPV